MAAPADNNSGGGFSEKLGKAKDNMMEYAAKLGEKHPYIVGVTLLAISFIVFANLYSLPFTQSEYFPSVTTIVTEGFFKPFMSLIHLHPEISSMGIYTLSIAAGLGVIYWCLRKGAERNRTAKHFETTMKAMLLCLAAVAVVPAMAGGANNPFNTPVVTYTLLGGCGGLGLAMLFYHLGGKRSKKAQAVFMAVCPLLVFTGLGLALYCITHGDADKMALYIEKPRLYYMSCVQGAFMLPVIILSIKTGIQGLEELRKHRVPPPPPIEMVDL